MPTSLGTTSLTLTPFLSIDIRYPDILDKANAKVARTPANTTIHATADFNFFWSTNVNKAIAATNIDNAIAILRNAFALRSNANPLRTLENPLKTLDILLADFLRTLPNPDNASPVPERTSPTPSAGFENALIASAILIIAEINPPPINALNIFPKSILLNASISVPAITPADSFKSDSLF